MTVPLTAEISGAQRPKRMQTIAFGLVASLIALAATIAQPVAYAQQTNGPAARPRQTSQEYSSDRSASIRRHYVPPLKIANLFRRFSIFGSHRLKSANRVPLWQTSVNLNVFASLMIFDSKRTAAHISLSTANRLTPMRWLTNRTSVNRRPIVSKYCYFPDWGRIKNDPA